MDEQGKPRKRAAIYLRISKESEHSGDAIERQHEDCEFTCRYYGYEVVKEYVDRSISAYSGKTRPAYDRMIGDYRAGKIDVIVAWKLDRLTRSTKGFAETLGELEGQKLCLCTSDLGFIDLSRPDSRFVANMLVNFAEFESARKSERQRRANEQRAMQGRAKKGVRVYGYDRDGVVIEDEAENVRAIYSYYLKGSSISAITRAIAGEGDGSLPLLHPDVPPPAKGPKGGERPRTWNITLTARILSNPRYAGYMAHVPTTAGKNTPHVKRWADFIVRDEDHAPVTGDWEPIVDAETWWAANAKRQRARYRQDGGLIHREGQSRRYFGSGVYRCGVCGAPVQHSNDSYRCVSHKGKVGEDGRPLPAVSRMSKPVDEFVLAVVRARLGREDLRDLLLRDEGSEIEEIDKRLSAARGELARARADYRSHNIDGPLYREIREEQQAIVDDLEAQRLKLLPDDPTAQVLNADDPVEAFDAIRDPGQIAAVINALCTVRLLPHRAGVRNTPESLAEDVVIEWKA